MRKFIPDRTNFITHPYHGIDYDHYNYYLILLSGINNQINFNLRLIRTLENTKNKCGDVLFYDTEFKKQLERLKETIRELREQKCLLAEVIRRVKCQDTTRFPRIIINKHVYGRADSLLRSLGVYPEWVKVQTIKTDALVIKEEDGDYIVYDINCSNKQKTVCINKSITKDGIELTYQRGYGVSYLDRFSLDDHRLHRYNGSMEEKIVSYLEDNDIVEPVSECADSIDNISSEESLKCIGSWYVVSQPLATVLSYVGEIVFSQGDLFLWGRESNSLRLNHQFVWDYVIPTARWLGIDLH